MVTFTLNDKENDKTTTVYNKTPHPGKETASFVECTGSNEDETKTQLFEDETKPSAAKKVKPNGDDGVVEMDTEAMDYAVTEEEWKAAMDGIENEALEFPEHQERLLQFIDGETKRKAAQKKIEDLQNTIMATLGDDSAKAFLKTIVPVHAHLDDKMTQLENDLGELFGDNHKVRLAIGKKLETYRKETERKYNGFLARLNKQPIEEETAEQDDTAGTEVAGENPEIDWDAIVDIDPSSNDAVNAFLTEIDKWNEARTAFGHALDDIHESIAVPLSKMLDEIAGLYQSISDPVEEQFNEIRFNIVANHHSRVALKNALKEALENEKKKHTTLLARVGGSNFISRVGTVAKTPYKTVKKGLQKGKKGGKKFFGNKLFGKKK